MLRSCPVIVRVLTAHVARDQVGQFNDLIRGELQELRTQPGLVYAKLARRLDKQGGEEVVLFEEWATPADLWAWTGGRLTEPRLLPGTEELVEDLVVTHFEALDVDVGDVDMRSITDARGSRGRGMLAGEVGEAPA
jgi:heme-degrading monooxygenase HmoA